MSDACCLKFRAINKCLIESLVNPSIHFANPDEFQLVKYRFSINQFNDLNMKKAHRIGSRMDGDFEVV
ncbi:hypothetical protein CWO84_21315 [Methylomonas sp. Kb3]|nr:hypothetical protein CWO84_21315 [Methylomonas sp. Kb3]